MTILGAPAAAAVAERGAPLRLDVLRGGTGHAGGAKSQVAAPAVPNNATPGVDGSDDEDEPDTVAGAELPNATSLQSTEDRSSLLRRLMAVVHKYSERSYVPYIWGGNALGDQETCTACRACVAHKQHLRVERRQQACPACAKCGIDCSHFVNRVFREAGLAYPYLATGKLKQLSAERLRREFGLVDIGRDLRLAKPGDLLVHRRHVVILLGLRAGTHGDFIHVSRSIKRGRIGGIELVRDKDLLRYRGRLVRILRHTLLGGDQVDLRTAE